MSPPVVKDFHPPQNLRNKIARYFTTFIKKKTVSIETHLPVVMPSWGRVRIANGGDTIRSGSLAKNDENLRNMSYVRV